MQLFIHSRLSQQQQPQDTRRHQSTTNKRCGTTNPQQCAPQLEDRADRHEAVDGEEEGDEEETVGDKAGDPVGVSLAQEGVQVALWWSVGNDVSRRFGVQVTLWWFTKNSKVG